jgi:dienelactone hydrolase
MRPKNTSGILLLVGTTVLSLSLSGCIYYGQYGKRPDPAATETSLGSVDPDYFHEAKNITPPRTVSHRKRDGYSIEKLAFKSHKAFLYRPNHVKVAPAIIILPITQGDFYTKEMAHLMAQQSLVVLRFQSHGHLTKARKSSDAVKSFETLLKNDVLDVMESVQWLSDRPYVDPDRIGIVGISMGAIIASIAAGADPKIRAGVFILGGGDLAGILFTSKEPSVVALRERMEEEEDLTRQELIDETARRLHNIDPLTYATRLDPNRILMINGYFDHVIRRRYAKELWKAAGEPPMVMLPTGHYLAVLFFHYAQDRALEHFQRVFRMGKAGPEVTSNLAPK